jgi:hypothetical protein
VDIRDGTVQPERRRVPGLVAAGSECVDVCDTDLISVERSMDGLTWSEVQIPSAMAATGLGTLSARDGRALLGGALSPRTAPKAVLWYDDATAGWTSTRLVGGAGYFVTSVLGIDGRELVIGQSSTAAPKAWLRSDQGVYSPVGIKWARDRSIRGAVGEGPLLLLVNDNELWLASF